MAFIIKHRSMEPPLYLGAATLVSLESQAKQFESEQDAKHMLDVLGEMSPLYMIVTKRQAIQ